MVLEFRLGFIVYGSYLLDSVFFVGTGPAISIQYQFVDSWAPLSNGPVMAPEPVNLSPVGFRLTLLMLTTNQQPRSLGGWALKLHES